VIVRLDAPPRGRIFSTDFPAVEGSRLLELRLPIVDGKAEWRQALPIRGEYRLNVRYFAGAEAANLEQNFTFRVYEKRQKWLILGAFVVGLFLIGLVAGRIFSPPVKEKALKLSAAFTLFLTLHGITVSGTGAEENHKPQYTAKLDVSAPTVGAPARVRWWLHSAGVEVKRAANLSLSIMHLEKNTVVFSIEEIPVVGEFSFAYHFTDGSEHQVSVTARTQDGETLRQEQRVSVTALAPSSRAQLPALALLLLVIFLGVLAGRWTRRS
jgi:hypothetical protein